MLARALRDAVRLQLVARAVTDAVIVPPPRGRHVVGDLATIARVREAIAASPQPWRTAGILVLHTGMRRGELCGLRWPDADLEGATLTIRRTRTTTHDGRVVEGPPKTRSGARVVPLDPTVVEALREWRRVQLEARLAAGPRWQGADWVLTLDDGAAPRPDAVTHWWVRTARGAGLGLRLHDLRHLTATLMAQAGVPPRVIAEILGHARASFTLDTYAGVPDVEALRTATQTLARIIAAAGP